MKLLQLFVILIAVLLLFLVFLSVIQVSVVRLSRMSLRVMAETVTDRRSRLLAEVARDKNRFLLPIELALLLLQVSLTVLVTSLLFSVGLPYPVATALLCSGLLVGLFQYVIPGMVSRNNPEKTLLFLLHRFNALYRLLRTAGLPMEWILYRSRESSGEQDPADEDDATEEEIQAYLGVGEEEGIFEEEESELIQSALEFGSTLVREIMTPRTEIVSIEESATLRELREVIVSSKHSRIPVYRERVDQIVGIVYVRNLLAHLDDGKWERPISSLISPAMFVPEIKRVAELLKEMQARAEHVAVVVNEYGAITGLVSMEDLVEEIVGEIRDEDESIRVDLSYEGNGTYIVRGSVAIEELEEALKVDLGEPDVTTVSGLIVTTLGKVPLAGESLVMDGLAIEVLSADRKKIHALRVRRLDDQEAGKGAPDHSEVGRA